MQRRTNTTQPIDEWTEAERDELAVPEYDPGYLPIDMPPAETWRPARKSDIVDMDTLIVTGSDTALQGKDQTSRR